MYFPFYIDPVYFWTVIVTLVISLGAQAYVTSAYKKWDRVKNSTRMRGKAVADAIVKKSSLRKQDKNC